MTGWSRAEVARTRVQGVAAAIVGLGVVVYLFSAYQVLQSGGLSVSSELGTCAEAATGRFTTGYRMGETLVVDHGFFPPSATCRWSGGTEAVLVAPTWTWTGLVLVGAGAVVLLVLRLVRRG